MTRTRLRARAWAGLACAVIASAGLSASRAAAAPPVPIPLPSVASSPGSDIARTYQVKRVGSFEVAPLKFEGVRLFDIAAPALQDPKAVPPVAARVDLIDDNFFEVVPAPTTFFDFFKPAPLRFDPTTFQVKVETHNGYPTLVATDGTGGPAVPLLTVTELDAKYNGVPAGELASAWALVLDQALGNALRQRAPGALESQLTGAALVVLAAFVITLIIVGLRLWMARYQAQLATFIADGESTPDQPKLGTAWWRKSALAALEIISWVLGWSIALVWAAAVLLVLHQFGSTQALARRLTTQLGIVFLIWLLAGFVDWVANGLIGNLTHVWSARPFGTPEEAQRRRVRARTIAQTLEYAKSTLVYVTAAAVSLSVLGVSASAVVTLGAAVAFAVSFGAQSLVKDFVNGFFIIAEDQYAIGDVVTIGSVSGMVEGLTLRISQLRAADGRLITIPNSQVAVVENWTRGWSRVDYRIAVAFDADLEHALTVFTQVLSDVARDPVWGHDVSEPARILGVESVSSLGAVLRGQVRTPPGKMFDLAREINRRMLRAFVTEGILLGMPISRIFEDGANLRPAQKASAANAPAADAPTAGGG